MSQDEAYREAGYKPNRGNASTLASDQNISKRVAEIQERGATRAEVDRAWVLQSLARNVRIAMGDETVKLKVKPRGADQTVELEMSDRDAAAANRALELLGKELGMFVDRTENVNIEHVVSDEPITADEWRETHATEH